MITLYTINGCIDCFKAKVLLDQLGIEYMEVNLMHEPAAARNLIEAIGEVRAPGAATGHFFLAGEDLLKRLEHGEVHLLE